jgi:hypothetical protein
MLLCVYSIISLYLLTVILEILFYVVSHPTLTSHCAKIHLPGLINHFTKNDQTRQSHNWLKKYMDHTPELAKTAFIFIIAKNK